MSEETDSLAAALDAHLRRQSRHVHQLLTPLGGSPFYIS